MADQGVLYGMTGEGRVGYIDTRDIAAVAARVLTSPGHQGTSYTLTGPEALSAAEVAERLLVLAVASRTSSEGAGLDLSLLCGLFGIRCPHDPVLRRILPQIVTKAQSASKVARPRLVSPTCDRCRSLADAPPQGGHQASAVEAAAGRSRPRSTGVRSCSASTWPLSPKRPPASSRTSAWTASRSGVSCSLSDSSTRRRSAPPAWRLHHPPAHDPGALGGHGLITSSTCSTRNPRSGRSASRPNVSSRASVTSIGTIPRTSARGPLRAVARVGTTPEAPGPRPR